MTTATNENILMMFEEINQKLDDNARQLEKIGQKEPEKSDNNDFSEFTTVLETFQHNQSEKLAVIESLIRKEKRKIEFTPTSTFGMVLFFSLTAITLALAVWVNSLKNQMSTLSDNDLKYRYIQMQGNATADDLATMDTLFYFNRSSKKIRELRKQVEVFEENVKQRAKLIEQEERLKEEKMKLDREILDGKKFYKKSMKKN
ncbi:MAG: hypothetical protein PHZ12_09315 [Paludibacter sp.]|jgi:hypothetical protein|nr:hypothetical protein [Paludibacter sp.]